MSMDRQYSFWGSLSPLGGLMGAGLLIMASARLSWAVTVSGCLIWVYGLTSFSYSFLSSVISNENYFPSRGRLVIYACLACFWANLYIFLFWLMCPMAALEVFFLLLLVPLFCAGNAERIISENNKSIDIAEHVSGSLSFALILICLLFLFSIVREPLAYCSLTFPGRVHGMVTIMYFNANAFFPIQIFGTTAGAFILLGYIICLYQYCKSFIMPGAV